MATALVERMADPWKPERYTDEYRSALLNVIHEKARHGGKIPAGGGEKKKRPGNVVDLVSVLEQSLNEVSKSGGTKAKAKGGKSAGAKHAHKKAA
jgi:DNA end-binding protein Ku